MTDGQPGSGKASESEEPPQAPPDKGTSMEDGADKHHWYRSFDKRLAVIGVCIAVPAALGGLLSFGQNVWALFQKDPPTFHLVLDPRADVGGVAVLPVSAPVKPVEYLRAGTPVTIDCVKRVLVGGNGVTNVYARMAANEVLGGAWVDGTDLFTRDDKPMLDAIPEIPACPSEEGEED